MQGFKILVIDEDKDNQVLIKDVIDSYKPDYKQIFASDGEEGLKFATESKADLVLMDLSIPKVSGWELVKQLREIENYSKVPIVAITAHAMKGDKEKVISIGYDDYLSKPYRPKELLSVINKHLKDHLN